MSAAQLSLVDRSVRTAARRLVSQSLLNNVAFWLAVSTGVALAWFVAQPLLLESPPVWLRWTVLVGLTAVGLGMAVWQTVKSAPTKQSAALEVDSRFNLRERVTTALSLTPDLLGTPAGEAVAADAVAKVKPLSVGEKFPVKPRWTAAVAPVLAVAITAVVLWWNPAALGLGTVQGSVGGKEGQVAGGEGKNADVAKKPPTPEEKKLAEMEKRENRDPKFAELDADLKGLNDKFDKDPYDDLPEKARERVAEVTKAEEKAEKFAKEKEREVKQLADTLGQLDKLSEDKDFQGDKENDAKELAEALAKGKLEQAEEELEGLQKKAEENKLTPQEAEKLQKQLDKIEDELERLEREQEKKKEELEKKKEEAEKQNNKEEAEQLDRELEKLKQEQEAGQDAQELGDQLQKASDALEKGDQQAAAEALQKAKQSVKKMEGKDGDFQEAQARAQQLKKQRAEAATAAQAAEKKKGDELTKSKSGPNKGGVGSGERDINRNAETDKEETRIRSLQDLKGETKYGGLTEGKGFKKATDKELGGQIKKAVQDAPGAADVQRLPRESKESVADYFKKLGGEGK